jgi:hypothetical protein
MHLFRSGHHRIAGRVTALTTLSAQLALMGALPCAAFADFYLHSWQNEHATARQLRFDFQAGRYSSTNNFDGAGALVIPSEFLQYTRLQTDVLAAYGINSKLSAFARVSWARTELDQTSLTSTNFGFGDSSAGLTYRLLDLTSPATPDGVTVDVQVQGDFPLYSNENLTGPALGDGTIDVTGGAFASVPLLRPGRYLIGLSGGAGFTYRTDDYSRALPWSVSVKFGPTTDTGFTAKAMASGIVSLSSDPRAEGLAAGSTALSAQSGGSFIAGAVNPSILTLRGEAGYQIGADVGLTAFFAQSVWGQAAPNGFFGGLALRLRAGGARPTGDPTQMTPPEYGRANQGFVNYALEAKVTRVNDRLNLVKLNKGNQDGVEAGQIFDIFKLKKNGSPGEPIARGKVTSVKLDEAVLTIDEYFKEVWIDEGFVAKRPVQ